MRKYYAVVLLVLLGCGDESTTTPTAVDAPPTPPTPDTETPPIVGDASVGQKRSTQTSGPVTAAESALLVETNAERPECDDAARGRLVYVRAESAFQFCDDAGSWVAVELRGPAGADGATGSPGIAGMNGVAGATGPTGQRGEKGEQGDAGLAANLWKDPMTDTAWSVGLLGTFATAGQSCTGAWRLPTQDELAEAALHGMMSALTLAAGYNIVWAETAPNNNSWAHVVTMNGPNPGGAPRTETHGIFCISDLQ